MCVFSKDWFEVVSEFTSFTTLSLLYLTGGSSPSSVSTDPVRFFYGRSSSSSLLITAYPPSTIIGLLAVCFSDTFATVAFWNTDTGSCTTLVAASGTTSRCSCWALAAAALSYCIFCSYYLCSSCLLCRSCSWSSYFFLKSSCLCLSKASFFSFSFYLRSSSFCFCRYWRV